MHGCFSIPPPHACMHEMTVGSWHGIEFSAVGGCKTAGLCGLHSGGGGDSRRHAVLTLHRNSAVVGLPARVSLLGPVSRDAGAVAVNDSSTIASKSGSYMHRRCFHWACAESVGIGA